MKTITFYSYKGGTGRSLALANAARYLARMEFKVVALDFDLEAPGLHYKFSSSQDGKPLPVHAGVVDYLHSFIVEGTRPKSLKELIIDIAVPGAGKPLIQLIPAGRGPLKEYWSKLSRINWHDLFYSEHGNGVQLFFDLKIRIEEELQPDFLLIDSRTGITEMGGVATTLLADKVVSLVLPSQENLDGVRAVLRSLRRSRRDSGAGELEVIAVLSRLRQMEESSGEEDWTKRIRTTLNEEADDLRDTLSFSEIFVLHSETELEIREALRVGSGVSPDDSVLLRDYLRLFGKLVPRELIEPKVGKLIQHAKEKIWENPDGALKEVEEMAESFGHAENYRALLHFYEVRGVSGTPMLKAAQRLWELTGDSAEILAWKALVRAFDPILGWNSMECDWNPNLAFVEGVWRNAGKRDSGFAGKIINILINENLHSRAADILLEVIQHVEATVDNTSRCIALLDRLGRTEEADDLIQQLRPKFEMDTTFVEAWARHALQTKDKKSLTPFMQPGLKEVLRSVDLLIAAKIYDVLGAEAELENVARTILRGIRQTPERFSKDKEELVEMFGQIQKKKEYEKMTKMFGPIQKEKDKEEWVGMFEQMQRKAEEPGGPLLLAISREITGLLSGRSGPTYRID